MIAVQPKEIDMLYYAGLFFIMTLLTALFAFGGLGGAATGISKILFFVFLFLFVASLVTAFFVHRPD